jgi:hypothetical protein
MGRLIVPCELQESSCLRSELEVGIWELSALQGYFNKETKEESMKEVSVDRGGFSRLEPGTWQWREAELMRKDQPAQCPQTKR